MKKSVRTAITTAAIATAGTTALSAVAAAPSQAAPNTSTLCSFDYPNPNLSLVRGSSTATATPDGPGSVRLSLSTDSMSILGYPQRFGVAWANLTTGKNGQRDVTERVVGRKTVLTLPRVSTGPGRVTFVLSASNTGSLNPKATSYGDCGAEYSVR